MISERVRKRGAIFSNLKFFITDFQINALGSWVYYVNLLRGRLDLLGFTIFYP